MNNKETIKENKMEEELQDKNNVLENDGEANVESPEIQENGEEEKSDAEKLADATKQIEELKNKLLYKQAEFENYRKRVIAEKTELILNGGRKVLEAMLPVVDDLERAQKNMNSVEDVAAVKEGVDLICKKFLSVLKAQGVTPIDTEGADFNVDLHEAIAQIPAPADELKGKVLDCTLKGYMLNDTVLRYAQVAVAL